MTPAPGSLPMPSSAQDWLAMARLVSEASALGVLFRSSGAGVVIEMPQSLPTLLQAQLERARAGDLLRRVLAGGDDGEREAISFADRLGVDRVVVIDRRDARHAIRELIRDLKDHSGVLAIDVETSPKPEEGLARPAVAFTKDGVPIERQPLWRERAGLDPRRNQIGCMQLYGGGAAVYLFRGPALDLLLRSHWLRRQRLVAHNAGFEAAVIGYHADYTLPACRHPRGRLDCSAQAGGLIYGVGHGGEGRKLERIAKLALKLDMPKGLQTSDWGAAELSSGQIAYACSDVVVVHRLWRQLYTRLIALDRWRAYELQRGAIAATVAMERNGLRLDTEEHSVQVRQWAQDLTTARREYQDLTGAPPPANEPEIRAWLERVLADNPKRLANWPRTAKTGLLSSRTEHLKYLGNVPSARPVLAIKAREQLLRNFGHKLLDYIHPRTGRVHCDYNIAGTKSGRFSSSRPNLQQLPATKAPEFKRCIVAGPGNLLVGADYDQIELRGAAWISQDRAMTAIYAEADPLKRDLHTKTAAAIAGIPLNAVTKEQRQAAKPVNYGSIYGISAAGLQQSAFNDYAIEMSLDDAERALDRFFRTFPELAQWRERNYREVQRYSFVRIGCGRVVEAQWERERRISLTQACNLPIQGIAADCMLRALARVHRALQRARIRGGIVACVHDELLLDVAVEDAEDARHLLEEEMRAAFIATFPGAPTHGVATAEIGQSWWEIKR